LSGRLASDDAQLAAFIRDETIKRIDEIKAKARAEFEDRSADSFSVAPVPASG
jgi:hypothetical protein